MRAIPNSLLIHSATLVHPARKDRWGKEVPGTQSELSNVRMEPSSKVVKDKDNNEIQLAATLFFDCKNSRPRLTEFALDDQVVFNGQAHRVVLIEPLYDGQKLHHFELGLVRHA